MNLQTELVLQKKSSAYQRTLNFLIKYKYLNLMVLPCLAYIILFKYVPMYGIILAFKDYNGMNGFWGIITSEWSGFIEFKKFFGSIYFGRLMKNTLLISSYRLLFGFPAPIILALLINEIKNVYFKRVVQTVTYMPHFLSWIIASGFVIILLSPTTGPVNMLLKQLGIEPIFFVNDPRFFRGILVVSSIWKNVGWGTIIYLAAISSINPEIYEAATIDGAQKWHKVWYITIPGIKEIIAILLILSVGKVLDENFEQIFNLYNPAVYGVADVFETYVYRQGIVGGQFAFASAVGLFKSVAGIILVYITNKAAKKLGSEGLW